MSLASAVTITINTGQHSTRHSSAEHCQDITVDISTEKVTFYYYCRYLEYSRYLDNMTNPSDGDPLQCVGVAVDVI